MKKFLWFALFFPFVAMAQTQPETEAWILAQASAHYNLDLSYQIEEGEFISTLKGYETRYKTSLPIKDITSISYLHTDRFLSFQFKCKDECAYLLITDNYDKYISDQKKTGFLFELYGKIDASMIPRIQKALLHLIEIQGGKAQLVPYQKPKEAF